MVGRCGEFDTWKSRFRSLLKLDLIIMTESHYLWQKLPPEVFCKKIDFKNFAKFTGKHLCWNLFFNKIAGFSSPENIRKLKVSVYSFIRKETPTQPFSCEFCEIFKNTFSIEHIWVLILLWGFPNIFGVILNICCYWIYWWKFLKRPS